MFTLVLVAALPPPDPTKPDPAALAGEWRLASTADAGRTDAGGEDIRMTIDGAGKVLFTFGPVETNRGTLALPAPTGNFRSIDLKLADGQTLPGVYALDGDVLVLCFDQEGRNRPAGLKPTGTQWAERWTRLGR